MPVETPSIFAQVIREHLDLKERNARLGHAMPIEHYKDGDPFENHPLFKSEEQARIEETMDGVQPEFTEESIENALAWPPAEVQSEAPTAEAAAPASAHDESAFWGSNGARDFDWAKDGVASLWLLALIFGFVLWIAVLGHGVGPR